MRAAREVDHQAVGRGLGHPGAELAGPAAERGQERGLSRRVRDAGDEVGAERHGLAERLSPVEATRLGQRGECCDLAEVADLRDHGKRRFAKAGLKPQHPVRSEAREPERQDAAGPVIGAFGGSGHWRAGCFIFLFQSRGDRSGSRVPARAMGWAMEKHRHTDRAARKRRQPRLDRAAACAAGAGRRGGAGRCHPDGAFRRSRASGQACRHPDPGRASAGHRRAGGAEPCRSGNPAAKPRDLGDQPRRAARGVISGSGRPFYGSPDPARPVSRMERALGPGGCNAMRGHGGWCAEVVAPGIIAPGDRVSADVPAT